GNLLDASGFANDGVAVGAPGYVPGAAGSGLSLDGFNDFVQVADSASLNPTAAISISAWWFSTSFSGSGSDPIVDKGASCHCYPYYQYQLGVSGDQYPYPSSFSFIVAANGAPAGAGSDLRFYSTGRWYHVVGTYDGSTMSFYADGVRLSHYPATGSIVSYARPVRFGCFNNLPQFHLPGVIDEIRIYDRALSADEVSVLHESPDGRPVVKPATARLCRGGDATFEAIHLDAPGATYLWSKDGAPIPTETGKVLLVPGAQGSARYSCLVTTACGVHQTPEAELLICASDYDCDGTVDFFDYDAFVNCFEGIVCPPGRTADFDGDGSEDFFDYDAFVVAFETPCQ
ncbi:MAG: LamG-like jellyroll fold domain-containing protein, partial [Planctomycetota bacterium]